jgi:hypothetical protein
VRIALIIKEKTNGLAQLGERIAVGDEVRGSVPRVRNR